MPCPGHSCQKEVGAMLNNPNLKIDHEKVYQNLLILPQKLTKRNTDY
jgi:hypothetical protein